MVVNLCFLLAGKIDTTYDAKLIIFIVCVDRLACLHQFSSLGEYKYYGLDHQLTDRLNNSIVSQYQTFFLGLLLASLGYFRARKDFSGLFLSGVKLHEKNCSHFSWESKKTWIDEARLGK